MHTGRFGSRRGESLIESCFALLLVLLIFLGIFQISQAYAAREVLCHAAARGARAKTVGFNEWMVLKCIRVAAIPNSGRLRNPAPPQDPVISTMLATMKPGALWDAAVRMTPHSLQYDLEMPRIPQYLGSDYPNTAQSILDYDEWNGNSLWRTVTPIAAPLGATTPGIKVTVSQQYPMKIPMHRTFYAPAPASSGNYDRLPLSGESTLESHYSLYLDDENL